MRISRNQFAYFLISVALVLIVVLCVVAGCQASVRIDPGTAEVSHTHRVINIGQAAASPPPTVIHVRVINPGDTRCETSHPGGTTASVRDPVPSTVPATNQPR